MIYGYIRVSTDKQTIENQRFEIVNYCRTNKLHIDRWVEETVSSRVPIDKRKLGILLRSLSVGDVLLASELSRFGRNLFQVMWILQTCLEKECQIWTIKENYKLGTDISSKVLAFAFSLAAEIERQLISQRTKEALLRAKASGKHLGRPFACEGTFSRLRRSRKMILRLMSQQVSKRQIAKKFKVTRGTITRFLKDTEV